MQNLLARDIYFITRERTVLKELITLYCVRYDPYYCRVDPERIWSLISDHQGGAHAAAVGMIDFYVPEPLITQVLLMDSGLKIRTLDSYI
jgi:hypothetical protein